MRTDTRIYLYHVEKTGGRSTARSILAAIAEAGGLKAAEAERLADQVSRGHSRGKAKAGPYSLSGPDACFRVNHSTLIERPFQDGWIHVVQFRDPMERIISHYRMLLSGDQSPAWKMHAGSRTPGTWKHFAAHAPLPILMRHLNMLSKNASVQEALENVEKMDHVLFLLPGIYEHGLQEMGKSLALDLRPQHYGPSRDKTVDPQELLLDEEACGIIRERAEPEFELWEKVRPPTKEESE